MDTIRVPAAVKQFSNTAALIHTQHSPLAEVRSLLLAGPFSSSPAAAQKRLGQAAAHGLFQYLTQYVLVSMIASCARVQRVPLVAVELVHTKIDNHL